MRSTQAIIISHISWKHIYGVQRYYRGGGRLSAHMTKNTGRNCSNVSIICKKKGIPGFSNSYLKYVVAQQLYVQTHGSQLFSNRHTLPESCSLIFCFSPYIYTGCISCMMTYITHTYAPSKYHTQLCKYQYRGYPWSHGCFWCIRCL